MVVVCQWPARQLAVYKSLDFIPVLQLFCIFFADSQFTGAQAVFVVIVGIGLLYAQGGIRVPFPAAAQIEYNFYEGIDRRQMKELRELVWLREAYNLILMGPSGTGKTFLAAGLVFDAVKAGYKAYLMTMEDIVNCLRLKDISTPAMMTYNKILRAQLLAIDDIMLFPVKREEATAFFNLINTLHEKTSIIITTNKAPTEWVETLNDEILASALLDRLLYRCEVIKFTGSSYRLENRQTIFKTTTGTRNELMKP